MTEYEYLYIKQKKTYVFVLLVGRSTIVELVFFKKKLSLLGAAPNRQNFEGSNFSQVGVYYTHRVLCYLSAPGLPELDLLQSSGQSLFTKTFWVSIHTNKLRSF